MQLAAFATASLVLALTPGPGVLFIVARTLAAGRRAGLAAVAGVAAGNQGQRRGGIAGAGGAVRALAAGLRPRALGRRRRAAVDGGAELAARWPRGHRRAGARRRPPGCPPGLLGGPAEPEDHAVLAALLPPFLDPAAPAAPQSLALGALFVAIAAATDSGYALAAGALAPRLARWPAAGARVAAVVYGLLGLYALAG
ncbi:MAG: LysE family translocator [Burkholderiaceae bacterium]|nr:LysE family translocator [Burkholderiaceae bacterium]